MKLDSVKRHELKDKASAALPGPWRVVRENDRLYVNTDVDGVDASICRVTPVIEGSMKPWTQSEMAEPERFEAYAEHIAATNPETMIALLGLVDDLAAALNSVEWLETQPYEPVATFCPWCGESKKDGHSKNCVRQRLLNEVY